MIYSKRIYLGSRSLKYAYEEKNSDVLVTCLVRCPHLSRQAALENTVSGNLTHVTGAELEHLGCNGIFLHEGLLVMQDSNKCTDIISKEEREKKHLICYIRKGVKPYLSVVELHGVISGQRNHQPLLVELRQRVLVVL